MTARDHIQLSLELATARNHLAETRAALDRFTDVAAIHHLDGRSKLYLANYHLKEAAALLETVGCSVTPPEALECGTSVPLSLSSPDAPNMNDADPSERSAPGEEQSPISNLKSEISQ